MSILDIKRFEQIEEMIQTIHKAFPHLPSKGKKMLTELVPYATFCVGVLLCVASLFRLVLPQDVFVLNHILLRIVTLMLGGILFVSFKPLSQWMKKGWYNLFYASLIQLLLTLMFFNVFTLLGQVISWYVLFEIKKEYS